MSRLAVLVLAQTLVLPGGVRGQQPGAVVGLSLTASPSSADLTIRTNGSVTSRDFRLGGPDRIVVDVVGARHALPRSDFLELARGSVQGVRTSQFDPSTVRIVVDLTSRIEYGVQQGQGWIRLSLKTPSTFDPWTVGQGVEAPDADPANPPTGSPTSEFQGARIPDFALSRSVVPVRAPDRPPQPAAAPGTRGSPPVPTSPYPSLVTVAQERAATLGAVPPTGSVEPDSLVGADTIVVIGLVTQLAGTTVYIDQGQGAGLFEGDTLVLLPRAGNAPRLLVLSSSASRAVLSFIGAPVPLTRGDRIRLERFGSAVVAEANPFERTDPGGTLDGGSVVEQARPRVSGRLFFDLNAIQSTTYWDGSPTGQDRTFLTPTARVNATATDLPGGMRLDLNARGSYRHASGGQVPSTTSIRFYDFSVSKSFEGDRPVQLQFGRFYNPHESFSGYWDGGLVRLGGNNGGIGAALGYRPDYSNEGFSNELPKFTIFGDLRRVGEHGGFASDVSLHRVTPLRDLEAHTFAGWAARGWWKQLQWSHEVQVDRVAETGTWIVTDFQAYASATVLRRLRAYGRISRRQPFDFWDTERQLAYRRDGVGGGLNVTWNTGSASADIGVRDADEGPRSTSYSGSLQLSRLRGSRTGLSAWGSYWSDGKNSGASLSPAITRPIGKGYARVGYRYYRSRSAFHGLDSHTLLGSLTAPVGPSLRMTLQGQAAWGGNLQNLSLYTGLSKSF